MQNNSKITLVELLGLVFIHSKLSNDIDWSWWYVLMPFIIQMILTHLFKRVKIDTDEDINPSDKFRSKIINK